MIQTISTKEKNGMAAWAKKALASAALVAALTSGLAVAPPAHAVTTTYTVNSTGDQSDLFLGDRTCDVDSDISIQRCTLRAAIEQANADVDAGVINFNIPGESLKTITPASSLPRIADPVTIDGYTQPGAEANTLAKGTNAVLKIELNGDDQQSIGLHLTTDNSVVRGLVINRFSLTSGIAIFDGTANKIEGNFIGTDASGIQDQGNSGGVSIDEGSTNNTVGGTTPAARNLISGNTSGVGIFSNSGDVTDNRVLGNLIGTKKDGTTALGNNAGVLIRGASNFIGNGTSGGANTIAFNSAQGVAIDNTSGNVKGNRVLRNSIFSNGALGIDLFPTLGVNTNDPGDADSGANEGQNFPVLSSAKTSSTKTTVTGKLNSTPSKSFKVQFFSNPSGTDEGKKFLGQKKVSTASDGKVRFTFSPARKVGVGQTITATATGPGGNTSEFSAPRKVVAS